MKRSIFASALAIAAIGLISLMSPPISQSVQTDQLPKSRLGIMFEVGLLVKRLDPRSTVEQAGLKVGDIIISTGLSGQVTSIEQFQKDIANLEPGTSVEIKYLRFNPTTRTFDELKTTVTTIPFPSTALSDGKLRLVTAFAQIGCEWCCQYCVGSFEPNSQRCAAGTRNTGKTDCRVIDGRWQFTYCA
jgi:predicted metalloprotease with PDZ domain